MTREAFEDFYQSEVTGCNGEWLVKEDGKYLEEKTARAWVVWQAATAAERERCAKVCEEEAQILSDIGEGCTTGQYDYMADGAERCADAIRKGE